MPLGFVISVSAHAAAVPHVLPACVWFSVVLARLVGGVRGVLKGSHSQTLSALTTCISQGHGDD